MNRKEKDFCLWYPSQCERWKWASAWAVTLTKLSYSGWTQNAMRHCIWQCLLTWYSGSTWAARWGWAHEEFTSSLDPLDKAVDYHNNYVGRLLGPHLGGWLSKPLGARDLCKGAWNAGYLWTVIGGTKYWSNGRRV